MIASILPVTPLLQAASSGSSPIFGFVFQIAAILAIFYFVMLRPQQKQRKQHEERLRNLKRGDTVVTAGGIIGEVMQVKDTVKEGGSEKTMTDQVTIKSGESRLIVERGRIARVTSGEATASPNT